MPTILPIKVLAALVALSTAHAQVVYQESFESQPLGVLPAPWNSSTTPSAAVDASSVLGGHALHYRGAPNPVNGTMFGMSLGSHRGRAGLTLLPAFASVPFDLMLADALGSQSMTLRFDPSGTITAINGNVGLPGLLITQLGATWSPGVPLALAIDVFPDRGATITMNGAAVAVDLHSNAARFLTVASLQFQSPYPVQAGSIDLWVDDVELWDVPYPAHSCPQPTNALGYLGGARIEGPPLRISAPPQQWLLFGVPQASFGVVFYGPLGPATPVGFGRLCLSRPVTRCATSSWGGSSQTFQVDLGAPAFASAGVAAGLSLSFQAGYRDSAPLSSQWSFTDVVTAMIGP
ncbi:MAG: hypothetical protein R3F49_10035 [Planctomycetota bacterium]